MAHRWTKALLRAVLVGGVLARGADGAFPVPPPQTAAQEAVWAAKQAEAKTLSEAATPKVLALFDSDEFRAELRSCCPAIAQRPSLELLKQLRAEVRVAELAHMFPIVKGDSYFQDMTLDMVATYPWFLNEWQAPLVNGVRNFSKDNHVAEEGVFGCDQFVNESAPTWDEASSRLIYIVHNLRQFDTGSLEFFGDVAAVFSNKYVEKMALIAPVDTGLWEFSCNETAFPKNRSTHEIDLHFSCPYWNPPSIGTLDFNDHLWIPSLGLFTGHSNSTLIQEAVRLFKRTVLVGPYRDMPAVRNEDTYRYWEANILGNPRFPEGVRYLVGQFARHFGTEEGRRVQKVADKYGWPLFWALGHGRVDKRGFLDDNTTVPGNQRVLDAVVHATALLNVTDTSLHFKQLWDEVAAARARVHGNLTHPEVEAYWQALVSRQHRVGLLTAAACSSASCIATNYDTGDCICAREAAKTEDALLV